jgi:hypothetical protein
MFGSTLALAGIFKVHGPKRWLREPAQDECNICRRRLLPWLARIDNAIDEDLQELFETPFNMLQLRALFRMYPQMDPYSAVYDDTFHTRAGKRTPVQKRASVLRHKGAA